MYTIAYTSAVTRNRLAAYVKTKAEALKIRRDLEREGCKDVTISKETPNPTTWI